MSLGLYVPLDGLSVGRRESDAAADFLELSAFFSTDGFVRTSDVANEVSIGSNEEAVSIDDEMRDGTEEIVSVVVQRIEARNEVLGSVYPFMLDSNGDILTFEAVGDCLGRGAYILSLVLSNLRTPLLAGSPLMPNDSEIVSLRRLFQHMSTAALAAEVQGVAWSFGSPRPDGSSFLDKLKEIWVTVNDGTVGRNLGAPDRPQDDKIDVFAARLHPDRLPGFLFAVAQVATGSNWAEKSLIGHLDAFKRRWFVKAPVTRFIPYMIIPFALDDLTLLDHVVFLGNILHRLRVPLRVSEAQELVEAGVKIEAYNELQRVVEWVVSYRDRGREAA